ncbi:MAG: hypothetical protein EOP40_11505 [Rubrivivax sp.]|nr:MAG: hypothetical protein EOP40_11505 [Rubrivivax sp.]
MNKFAASLLATSLMFAAPVMAQDSSITLRVDSGSVMASSGGEFVSANTGKPLAPGEKIMINAGSSASALFEGGCTVQFTTPGVYEVPGTCTKAAWNGPRGSNVMNAAIIVGTGLVVGALINSQDDVDVGPLSTAVRHL